MVPLNPPQALFLKQARSDFELSTILARQAQCHQPHYLQMATEKLAKVYFWRHGVAPQLSHHVFVAFLKALEFRGDFPGMFGYRIPRALTTQLPAIHDLAQRIQGLAPTRNPGPNPEYPWPPTMPTVAPVDHDFAEWHEWRETTAGRRLNFFVANLLDNYPAYFP